MVKQRIKKIFLEVFDYADINIYTSVEDIDAWDSMGHMNLIATLEEEFGVEFDFSEIVGLTCVGKIEHFLKEKGIFE